MACDTSAHRVFKRFHSAPYHVLTSPAEATDGKVVLSICNDNGSEFILEVPRQQFRSDLRNLTRIIQPDYLLNYLMDQAQIACTAFGFFTQAGIVGQAGKVTRDDHD